MCIRDSLAASDIDVQQAAAYVPELADLTGRISCNMGISGKGSDTSDLQAYGSAELKNGAYKDLPIESLAASFFAQGKDLSLIHISRTSSRRTSSRAAARPTPRARRLSTTSEPCWRIRFIGLCSVCGAIARVVY